MWEVTRFKLCSGLMDTFSAFLGALHTIQHFFNNFYFGNFSLCKSFDTVLL